MAAGRVDVHVKLIDITPSCHQGMEAKQSASRRLLCMQCCDFTIPDKYPSYSKYGGDGYDPNLKMMAKTYERYLLCKYCHLAFPKTVYLNLM